MNSEEMDKVLPLLTEDLCQMTINLVLTKENSLALNNFFLKYAAEINQVCLKHELSVSDPVQFVKNVIESVLAPMINKIIMESKEILQSAKIH